MAIYKYPSSSENSVMPFVYTCPAPKTILNRLDKLFVYGNYDEIRLAEAQLSLPFIILENRKKRLGMFVPYTIIEFHYGMHSCAQLAKFVHFLFAGV